MNVFFHNISRLIYFISSIHCCHAGKQVHLTLLLIKAKFALMEMILQLWDNQNI